MFSWGSNTPLAELAAQNQIRYIKARTDKLNVLVDSFYTVIYKDIIQHSNASSAPEITFSLANPDLCQRVTGLMDVTSQERDLILVKVSERLNNEGCKTQIDGTVLKVSWLFPFLDSLSSITKI